MYLPGSALAADESPALLQDLYARLGDDWLKMGAFSHQVYQTAANRQVIEAFFDIGFGKERVDALLDLRSLEIPAVEPLHGITIRRAGDGDQQRLGSMSNLIMNALAEAPYWHPTLPEHYSELQQGWADLAADPEWTVWMALEGEQVSGTVGFRPEWEEDDQLLTGPKTIYLSVAATRPEARRRGIPNDYHVKLFNGDVGIVGADSQRPAGRVVFFEGEGGELRRLAPSPLPPHETAFAMSVHKSQGSEFDEVAVLLPQRPSPVVTRELL